MRGPVESITSIIQRDIEFPTTSAMCIMLKRASILKTVASSHGRPPLVLTWCGWLDMVVHIDISARLSEPKMKISQ